MFLFFVGLVIFFVGFIASKTEGPFSKLRTPLRLVGLFVIGIGILTSGVRQIDSGNVGVLRLFGQVQKDNVLYEGLHLVNPLLDVEEMSIQQLNYTMSSVHNEGQKDGDDAVSVRCKDGLDVKLDITILYRLQPVTAPDVFQKYRMAYEETLIRPTIRSHIRTSASYYTATELYADKRADFEHGITKLLDEDFKRNGFILDKVLIRNIALPQSITESIERKIAAIQDAEHQDYILEKVKKEAEMKRQEAQGVADAQKILASGLSDKVLQYEQIKVQKELVNSPNAKIILMNGKTPVILDTKDK
ncbi:MAG: prohibitin family protein [Candidatus Kapabacteria bacterium]|nr:prohibitin family protein [Candidatus Kapabacteria bacterium]